MIFYRVTMGNGFCGYDEEFLTSSKQDLNFWDLLEMYTYTDDTAGLDLEEDEEFEECPYEELIADNSCCEEISEEEFIRLRDEEGWEVR